ncbi:Transketolase, partial [Spiromyces aspiralis]
MDDLKNFRQVDSVTPGHPERMHTDGIEVTTGPLGQGISNAVGLALAERHLAAQFNREGFPVVNNTTYCIAGDGCLQEGVASEACSLAGHLQLGNLVVLYDSNGIQIDGSTKLGFTEDVLERYRAYGWHTLSIEDGDDDLAGLERAIAEAKAVTDRPSIIKVTTTIGFGAAKAGTASVHGAPL